MLTREDPSPEKTNIFLAFLIITGLIVRFSLFHLHQIIEGDGVHYAALARIISHEGSLLGLANEYWSNLWPAIIAFFDGIFFHDIALAGRTASAVFGSLTVIPVYLIGRELYDKRTSLVAAALVVGQPFLIRYSVLLFTESFYTFIFAFALWLGLRLAINPDKQLRWVLFGTVIGLGLLTRPEIQALAVFFPLVALLRGLKKKIPLSRVLMGLLVFGLIVFSFISLRATLIWKYTGKWQFGFGEKAAINLRIGDKIYEGEQIEKYLNKFEDGEFTNREAKAGNPLSLLWKNRREIARRMGSNLGAIADSYYLVLPSGKGHLALVIASILFAALGIMSSLIQGHPRRLSVLLLIFFFFYSTPWLILFVLDRFVVPLTIIAILFTASGLSTFERGVFSLARARKGPPAWPVLALLLACVFIFRGIKWARYTYETEPIVQKEAGQYMRANFPQETRTLTHGPHVPYYFYEGNPYTHSRQNIPWASHREVLAYARKKKIDLLVLPEWLLEGGDYPIKNLVFEKARHKGLRFITIIGEEEPFRIWIYKVKKIPKLKKKKSRSAKVVSSF